MSDRGNVVEDGLTTVPERPPTRPSWLLGVVGFALGLGLGVLVVSPDPEPATETPVPPTAAATETPAPPVGELPPDPGVVGTIEEFPDAIVAIARTPATSLDHVLWPREGEVKVRSMTGGDNVVLDTSSQFIAFSDRVPGLDGLLLSMGRFNSIQPVASSVISYAWHDAEAAHLSFTQLAGDLTRMYTVGADLNPVLVGELAVARASVAGWGDWGWAIQQTPDEIVLLNPEGAFKDSEVGEAFASHGSGWLFAMEGAEAKLVSAGGGVRRIQTPLDVGTVRRAAFSPDGTRIAVVGSTGIAVLDIESQEVTRLSDYTSPSVAWSSDSRFVLAAAPSGVAVVDLEEPVVGYRVLDTYPALAVGVHRLRGS